MVEVAFCFLDRSRICEATCKAHNHSNSTCRLLENGSTISGAFKILMRWLGQHDPPKVN